MPCLGGPLRTLLVALALALPTLATAQVPTTHDPAGRWRTVETAHYRLHYPLRAEAWALLAAAELDDIRARVAEAVGYAPPQIVDVLVLDPFRQPNGFALPMTSAPRMALFATAPDADPSFGYYRSWSEELITHEDAHLVHLLRPSRDPLTALFTALTGGMTPMTLNAPPWVTEGYATVIEGRLTGMGRPNSDFRALMLRRLAQEGRLPTYTELSQSERFLGGAFRYMVGSAFLEWLEARAHDRALVDLWRRMTARRTRTFEEAFEGVFGASPEVLYGRFQAEITHAAMTLEEDVADSIWLDLSRGSGAPALSPDGARVALVVRPEKGPSAIAVYATADDADARAERDKDIAEMLARDPEDVAPVASRAAPRTPEATRVRNARPPGDPRWTSDGVALLYPAWRTGGDGLTRPDLYRWDPETDRETRITRGADIVDVDPHPDGAWAVGVRTSWGVQHLVRIDLQSGAWTPLTEADPTRVLDDPRFDPSGGRLAWLEHREGWHLMLGDAEARDPRELALPEGSHVSAPAWSPDGEALYVSLGYGGALQIARVPVDGGDPEWLTDAPGGATSPAVTADGASLYFLSLDADGLDVHRVALAEASARPVEALAGAAPVVRPPPPPPIAPPDRAEVTPRRYGAGRWEPTTIAGIAVAPGTNQADLGLRLGDVVGRHSLLILGGVGDQTSWRGLSAAYAWRGLPVTLGAQVYAVAQGGDVPLQRAGAALEASLDRWVERTRLEASAGAFVETPWGPDTDPSRTVAFVRGAAHPRGAWGLARAGLDVEARGRLGFTEDHPTWMAGEGLARVSGGLGVVAVGGELGMGRTNATAEVDRYRLGGFDAALVPSAWLWSRILVPAIPVMATSGEGFTTERAFLDVIGIQLGIERDRMVGDCDGLACAERTEVVLVGASFDGSLPAMGLARTPSLHAWGGLACLLDDPRAARTEALCAKASDWRGWLGLTWRP